MPYLRDNSYTFDRKLGRLIEADARSIVEYPIRSLLSPRQLNTPRSYTWSVSISLDQGNSGSCVGHAIAHELAARPVVVSGMTSKFAVESIYWEAQKIDPWPGGSYPGAEPDIYEGTSVLAGMKVAKSLGFYSEYRWALDESDLRISVGYKGPAVIGVNWYDGMLDTDKDGFIHLDGAIVGGHCVLVNGVNIPGKYYKIKNSWSSRWGLDGNCKISFEDMDFLLNTDGEAAIPVRHKI